jgi:hypothetical protein
MKNVKQSANRKQWAARSAIQKAIRRSDLGMFRAAFAILWDMDRNWLLWRLPILAIEEVWQYAGRSRHLIAAMKESDNPTLFRTEVHEFLEALCLSAKDHSTYALFVLLELHAKGRYTGPTKEPFKRRWDSLVRMIAYRRHHGDEETAAAVLEKAKNLTDREAADVAGACIDRFTLQGGMEGDRTMALIGGFLALTSFTGTIPPAEPTNESEPMDWPWWVYDHHTGPGKSVFPRIAQKLGMTRTELTQLSFAFTGGIRTPIAPTAFWPFELERVLDRLYPDRKDFWHNRVRDVVRQAVMDQIRQEPLEQAITLPFV